MNDPVRSDARKFFAAVVAVAIVVLGLFEAIAHRGEGPDAPALPGTAVKASAPIVPTDQ